MGLISLQKIYRFTRLKISVSSAFHLFNHKQNWIFAIYYKCECVWKNKADCLVHWYKKPFSRFYFGPRFRIACFSRRSSEPLQLLCCCNRRFIFYGHDLQWSYAVLFCGAVFVCLSAARRISSCWRRLATRCSICLISCGFSSRNSGQWTSSNRCSIVAVRPELYALHQLHRFFCLVHGLQLPSCFLSLL